METSELLKRVRKIEIKTKGLSKHIFSGEYHSAFKGRGMSFSEVRDYHYGDDIRNIDWNVTARTGDPHVKIFEEERELTVMLVIDVSRSSFFGSVSQLKSELITIQRPGHADLTGVTKYDFDDIRNSIERSSARETAARVAAASVARKFLEEVGISVGSYVQNIGNIYPDEDFLFQLVPTKKLIQKQ